MEKVARHCGYASKLFGVKDLNSSRTRWDKDEKSLYLKINRFGHAMDPERGMLAFYGSACQTKCSMTFTAESSTWFNTVPKEKEIRDYIQQNGLKTAFDYLHLFSLASGLFRFKEFKEIVSLIFSQLYQTYKERIIDVLSESLLDLWYDSIHEDEGSVYLHNIDPYIFEKLSEILVPVLEDFESGAGSSSAFLMFYSDNPEEIKSHIRKEIEIDLNKLKNNKLN